MGATQSHKASPNARYHKVPPNKRPYYLPSVRAKDRFNTVDRSLFASQFDPSIDKVKSRFSLPWKGFHPSLTPFLHHKQYDLLIIFPLTEGAFVDSKFRSAEEGKTMISWSPVVSLWKQSTPGTENQKMEAVTELSRIWERRTGASPSPKDRIRQFAWKSVAREAIVEKLAQKGLQLKLTSTKKNIYCRVRAPIKLLENQCDIDNYPLQLRGEIDPGAEEFWNRTTDGSSSGRSVEIEEAERLLSLDEARIVLEKLYRAGKISAADININPDDENQDSWSQRVHALERIADQVPVYNKYPAYTSILSGKPHLRYIFQTYPSVRGMTLFKSKDRLALTKSIIETCFDLDILEQYKVLDAFMALHDANRGERLTVDSLAKKWTTFWTVDANEVGAPLVTHPACEDGEELAWYWRPFAQPFADIRDYFGEKVALYYAWMGHFTIFLLIPALLAILMEIYYTVRGSQVMDDGLDWGTYVYAIGIVTWAAVYVQCWKRECYAIALKWGTRGFESEEKPRPQFVGEPQRSFITNEPELVYPESRRMVVALGSWGIIALLTAASFLLVFGIFYLEHISYFLFPSWKYSFLTTFVFALLIAVTIQVNSFWYFFVARWLNDQENYRTETDYEDNLVAKLIVFEVINSFGAAAFVAYAKEWVFDSCFENCFVDLRTLLYAILIVRVTRSTSIMIYTSLETYWRQSSMAAQSLAMAGLNHHPQPQQTAADRDEEIQSLVVDHDDDAHFLTEVKRHQYTSTFVDSSDVFFQFAYINLFSIIVPVLSIASLIENLVKIRVDAYKLCYLLRRPHAEQAEDTGFWAETMELMVYVGIYMNAALVTMSFPDVQTYSLAYRTIVFLAVSQLLVVYVMFIQYWIPSEPDYVRTIAARNEFIVNKFVRGFEDKNASAEELGIFTDQRGHIEDKVDVESLGLYDVRKTKDTSEAEYEEIEALDIRRRELMQELKIYRDRLQEVYKTEIFNDATGVGETKHGLPLGRLSIKLVKIEGFETEIIKRSQFPFRIRVEIRGTRVGATAPIQKLPTSLTDSAVYVMPDEGNVELNQSMGPFAPIKTIDAEVLFHLLFHDKERPNDAPQATVSIRLKDLENQKQHDKILKWKIRDAKAALQPSQGTLYVNLTFQYSKVVPIRNEIYRVQDQIKMVEAALAKIRSGKF